MSNFASFMLGGDATEIVEYVASKRFVDKDGKPVAWKIKPIDTELDELIRKECTKRVPIVGKRGQFTSETDTDKYMAKVACACTVYPDLNDAELQDFYKVKGAEALLKKLLLSGEYAEYKTKVMEVNGFDMSMDELVDDAKN